MTPAKRTTTTQRKYRSYRADGYTPRTALLLAKDDHGTSRYPFLRTFAEFSAYDEYATGEVDGLTVKVHTEIDEDSSIGDDDVTGHFTDTYEDGAIPNTVSYYSHSQNGQGYKYYVPANDTLENLRLNTLSRRGGGMSKGVLADAMREELLKEMQQDADREYWGVVVTIHNPDDDELAEASLWGCDVGDDPTYLREVAADLIDEVIAQAQAERDRLVRLAPTTTVRKGVLWPNGNFEALDDQPGEYERIAETIKRVADGGEAADYFSGAKVGTQTVTFAPEDLL